ncbi:ubiquitin carboxyl-terminal hydrolase family protein [Striga asiatica]|uniref:Ubiquitin carboxyl-terminal hydrolase family protein n=1 Tax=Striga asiatica TaxID=4170 RepID=A0A5A7R4S7_STRAF|nr:ubiquitin carboxyl-terminal hydrolase family protein [Striga asiatica]
MAIFDLLIKTRPAAHNPRRLLFPAAAAHFSTSFLVTKTPKKFHKKRKKHESPRTQTVQTQPNLIPYLESLLRRDSHFRFLTKTKDYLSKQSHQILCLDDAGKLHQQLGFPRDRKVLKAIFRHPLIFQTYRHTDNKMWLGFTDLMDRLLIEERQIADEMEPQRVAVVRKLLMMSANKRIPLSKIYHNRALFGIPEDFRDRVANYPDFFRIIVEEDGKRILELVDWDSSLAVSSLEKEFMADEDKAKRAFRSPLKHVKSLELDLDDERKLNVLNSLPLVSPYSDGKKLDSWTLKAEKYRCGVVHEFLSLTLEKRAYIHNIVEFKDELSLTRRTYEMLLKQPSTFYLGGTKMNWCVFLKDCYNEDGELVGKDPQVEFNERLYEYAGMEELESDD